MFALYGLLRYRFLRGLKQIELVLQADEFRFEVFVFKAFLFYHFVFFPGSCLILSFHTLASTTSLLELEILFLHYDFTSELFFRGGVQKLKGLVIELFFLLVDEGDAWAQAPY